MRHMAYKFAGISSPSSIRDAMSLSFCPFPHSTRDQAAWRTSESLRARCAGFRVSSILNPL